jgi:hypothetical protein
MTFGWRGTVAMIGTDMNITVATRVFPWDVMTVLHPTQMKVIERTFIWTDKLFPVIVVTSCNLLD